MKWAAVDTLYFVDLLGGMSPNDTIIILK